MTKLFVGNPSSEVTTILVTPEPARKRRRGGAMGLGATVEFQDVEVVAESDLALCCRVTERNYWIAPGRLLEGSSVAHFGDRGIMIVASEFAEDQGLVLGRSRPPR